MLMLLFLDFWILDIISTFLFEDDKLSFSPPTYTSHPPSFQYRYDINFSLKYSVFTFLWLCKYYSQPTHKVYYESTVFFIQPFVFLGIITFLGLLGVSKYKLITDSSNEVLVSNFPMERTLTQQFYQFYFFIFLQTFLLELTVLLLQSELAAF